MHNSALKCSERRSVGPELRYLSHDLGEEA